MDERRANERLAGRRRFFLFPVPILLSFLLPSVRWMMCEGNIICSVFTVDSVLSSSELLSQF